MSSFISVDAKYHRCRVVAVRGGGVDVDVALSVEAAEQFSPEQAFATGGGWVSGTLSGPLEVRFRYASPAEARSEATLFEHWRASGAVLEVIKSIESQGILVVEPTTGLFSGMRLGPAHLDAPDGQPALRP